MSVLITGAGLIGMATAEMLATRGQDVTLLDIRRPDTLPDNVVFEEADITNAEAISRIIDMHGIREVFHTAALLSSALRANPALGLKVNLLGTLNVLEAARVQGLRRVVLVSSTTVLYSGFSTLGPGPIPEDAALHMVSQRPGSLYAISKLANEQLGLLYRDLHGVDMLLLRYGAVIGGRRQAQTSVPGRLFSTLVAAARAGQPLRLDDPLLVWKGVEEFVDVRDCARAAVAALDAKKPGLGVYNIVHPQQWTLDAVIEAVAQIYGPLQVDYDRTVNTGFAGFPYPRPAPSAIDAATRELGFTPHHDLKDSLAHWW
ncbi:MAG: NAD-dependent epimerase/dehydratase family protein [Pseudorhodobacter sp.]